MEHSASHSIFARKGKQGLTSARLHNEMIDASPFRAVYNAGRLHHANTESLMSFRLLLAAFVVICLLGNSHSRADVAEADAAKWTLSTFSADVTCPLGHPLIAGLRLPAKTIVDRLEARGFVLRGGGKPIVLCAIDWCEIRNRSYDRWREALAKAAGTTRQRVLFCCLHQHDTPVTDERAAELLADAGLVGAMFDPKFERQCIAKTAAALQAALEESTPVTHIGMGKAKVERIASNRRVVLADGSISYNRGSSSGGNRYFREASDGLIDPWLRTLSFWNGDKPLLALHTYATHPMSYYGRGGVSADFVGQARRIMQREHPAVFQIYTSGCSGDVTAGKYNNGSPENRPRLAKRLFTAMQKAWKATTRSPLKSVAFRSTHLQLPFRPTDAYTADGLKKTLQNQKLARGNRILAAMGLASRERVATKQPIDFPCIDFGPAQILLFPGETFVGYQLDAQKRRPNSFVFSIGYGECWPGYIPTTQSFADKFRDKWLWVAPGSDRVIAAGVKQILQVK